MTENFVAAQRALRLTREDIHRLAHRLARNSFQASLLDPAAQQARCDELDAAVAEPA